MIRLVALLAIIILTGCTLAQQGAFDLESYGKNSAPSMAPAAVGAGIDVVADYGADPTGATSSDVAFQNAWAAANASPYLGVSITIPAGQYLLSQWPGNITRHRVHITGAGEYATTIYAASSLFSFANPVVGNSIYQCSISDLGIIGTGSAHKVAIDLEDVREFAVRNVAIHNWTDGGTNIALRICGREMVRLDNFRANSDHCIQVKANPALVWISADHFHWSGLYLNGIGSAPLINVDNDCSVFNWTIDGTNAFVGGGDGIRWSGAGTAATRALGISFSNIRREQAQIGNWVMDLQPSAGCRDFHLANIYGGYQGNGYRLKCDRATLDRIFYDSNTVGATAIDASQIARSMNLNACFWQVGPTAITTGLTLINSRNDTVDPSSFAAYGLWEK